MLGINISGNRRRREIVTAVEIGTHSVKVVMGEFGADGVVSIIGAGQEKTHGRVVKGEITDLQLVQEPLMKAMRMAEEAAGGTEIQNIFMAVTGTHIGYVNSMGSTVINAADRYVTEGDREDALRNAANYALPPDRQTLHWFTRRFLVDRREVDNAVGLFGGKLEADMHIVYGQHARLENSRNVIMDVMGPEEQEPKGLVFSPVAAGLAVFSGEEAGHGALVVDIGAGVTEYAVFAGRDRCLHSGQITIGCEQLANDLHLGLHLPIQQCRDILERLPSLGAKAVMTQDGRARLMEVDAGAGKPSRQIPVSTIEQIIEMRLDELFRKILEDLQDREMMKRIGFGVRLCGGGAMIPQIADLAQRIFESPVEIGCARMVNGPEHIVQSPAFVTPVGLLKFGHNALQEMNLEPDSLTGSIGRDWKSVREFLSDIKRAFRW